MKILYSTVLLLLSSVLFAQQGSFTINGTVSGLADKTLIAVTDPDNPTDTIAKVFSKKESFELKGNLTDTKLYHINFVQPAKKTLLFLEPAAMKLSGDLNAVQQLNLAGSKSQDGFIAFQKTFDPYFREYAQLSEAANKGGVNDSLIRKYHALVENITRAAAQFSTERKDQVVAPFMWATMLQVIENTELIDQQVALFTPEVKSSFYGRFLAARLADVKIGKVGTQALDFVQADTSGKPVSLSSFKGKYVLVDFWASWCGPCRQENPNVVRAHDRFKSKNFTVLGVSLDNNKAKWLQAIEADKLAWTQVSDLKYWQNEVALKYKVQSIPQNLLIDPQGVIIGKNLRGEELQARLCELLGCE